ncbi:hypothetical protein GQ85_29800, partial [Rhodococcus rhodochrous]
RRQAREGVAASLDGPRAVRRRAGERRDRPAVEAGCLTMPAELTQQRRLGARRERRERSVGAVARRSRVSSARAAL